MVRWILIALALVPVLEIAVFIKVGGLIGIAPTVGLVLASAVAGAALIRHQGLSTLAQARAEMAAGRVPLSHLFDGVCLLVAGALLLTPGFVTDAVGFPLLVPAVRRRLRAILAGTRRAGGGPTVIDGEYEDVTGRDRPPGTDRCAPPPIRASQGRPTEEEPK